MLRIIFFAFISYSPFDVHASTGIKDLYYAQSCTVFNYNEDLITILPGALCAFNDDGSFVSANNDKIRMFNNKNEVLWEIAQTYFHHQINLSNDKKRILALASGFIEKNNQTYRTDIFLVLSLTGKILFKQSSDQLLNETKMTWLNWPSPPFVIEKYKVKNEISHFNSFYEIPKNANQKIFPEGSYVVNSVEQGFMILSADLSKVLYSSRLKTSKHHRVHDVQVNSKGNILFFNNISADSSSENLFSTIEEIDILKNKSIYKFSSTPKAMFYSKVCGGVQELDGGHLLFSDSLNGAFIFSKEKNKVVKSMRTTHMIDDVNIKVQQVKAFDLKNFFKSRKQ